MFSVVLIDAAKSKKKEISMYLIGQYLHTIISWLLTQINALIKPDIFICGVNTWDLSQCWVSRGQYTSVTNTRPYCFFSFA